jgi:ribose-phosphate pyrophosphokinase
MYATLFVLSVDYNPNPNLLEEQCLKRAPHSQSQAPMQDPSWNTPSFAFFSFVRSFFPLAVRFLLKKEPMSTPGSPDPNVGDSTHVDPNNMGSPLGSSVDQMLSPSARTQPVHNAYYYSPAGAMKTPTKVSPRTVFPEAPAAATTKECQAPVALIEADRRRSPYSCCICCGNSNPTLAKQVCELLGLDMLDIGIGEAASGAVQIRLKETVASHDVYIIQSGCIGEQGTDLNTSVMELLLLIRRLKVARAERVTAVLPYFPYSRQDRKTELRCPLSASAMAQMLTQMGVDRVITLDLHSGQVQGTFQSIPLDNLWMYQEFAQWLREHLPLNDPSTKVAIVSPDAGGVVRARKLADLLNITQVVTIVKRRVTAGQVAAMQTVGDVDGYICIIVDDIIDTGGTLAKACEFLKELGAVSVYACCTHGIMSEPACTTISNCKALRALIVSDSIPQKKNLERCRKLQVLPIAPMLAQVIWKSHTEQSVSTMFSAPTPKSMSASQLTSAMQGFPSEPVAAEAPAQGGASPPGSS